MDFIFSFDQMLFEWINHDWQNPILDSIMPYWREKTSWIPAYVVLAVFLFWKYKLKTLYFIIALVLTVGLADQMSSQVIKKTVKRDRPCRELSLDPPARTLVHCGGGYSFPSSHATNHFAVAVFLLLTWGRILSKWKYLLLIWAASIAIGQVYVGVHYPVDISCGMLLGCFIGWIGSKAYEKIGRWRIDDFYIPKSIVA